MSQYALDLALPAVYSADNFFISGCNEDAHRWVTAWPHWPAHGLILAGPGGSGKTHLGHIWANMAQATMLEAGNLTISSAPPDGTLLVENIERLKEEQALLHLYNHSHETRQAILLTSALAVTALPFSLPDLTSRLLSMPIANIFQPDDPMLAGILRKQFADRQLKIEEDTIAYLLPRMERDLSKIQPLIELLDAQAIAEHKAITIPFVRRILAAQQPQVNKT